MLFAFPALSRTQNQLEREMGERRMGERSREREKRSLFTVSGVFDSFQRVFQYENIIPEILTSCWTRVQNLKKSARRDFKIRSSRFTVLAQKLSGFAESSSGLRFAHSNSRF